MIGQSVTTLKAKNLLLETELSNLKKKIASECSIASVSPRCEANNLLDDRVKILQLENLNLNTIIKNFTSSQRMFEFVSWKSWKLFYWARFRFSKRCI